MGKPLQGEEAYDAVVRDMLPTHQAGIIKAWVEDARAGAKIEYFGDYRSGKGRTARELLDRDMNLKDPEQKMDLYQLLVEDYPDDELVDDALFLAANEALDTWGCVDDQTVALQLDQTRKLHGLQAAVESMRNEITKLQLEQIARQERQHREAMAPLDAMQGLTRLDPPQPGITLLALEDAKTEEPGRSPSLTAGSAVSRSRSRTRRTRGPSGSSLPTTQLELHRRDSAAPTRRSRFPLCGSLWPTATRSRRISPRA